MSLLSPLSRLIDTFPDSETLIEASPRTDFQQNYADTALAILKYLFYFRRFPISTTECASKPCSSCLQPHYIKIVSSIKQNRPITFVLPAFPGKSPNPNKVLSHLPDLAEELSLKFLGHLAHQIKSLYSPGAQFVICSDGRVFSDTVGMDDSHITAYQTALSQLLQDHELTHQISIFNLDQFYGNSPYNHMRRQLLEDFAETEESVKLSVQRGKKSTATSIDQEAHRLYMGLTRFLFEDALYPGQTKTRTQIQKDSRIKAYDVLRKSGAWSHLIEKQFPDAVRLSIHPQGCGSKKLGLKLLEGDTWMTPWHGVAVENQGTYTLKKRHEAEAMGARLVLKNDRPFYFTLNQLEDNNDAN